MPVAKSHLIYVSRMIRAVDQIKCLEKRLTDSDGRACSIHAVAQDGVTAECIWRAVVVLGHYSNAGARRYLTANEAWRALDIFVPTHGVSHSISSL